MTMFAKEYRKAAKEERRGRKRSILITKEEAWKSLELAGQLV
jgi:hypothetical protein